MDKLKFKYLFCSIIFIIVLFYGANLLLDLPVLYGTDLRPQWYPFYEQFREMIENLITNRVFPFYSFDSFLGTDFFTSKSYYLTGDLFSYLGLFFKTNFFDTAMILNIIKFSFGSFSMYVLLDKYHYSNITKTIGAIAFGFSGWAIFYSGQLSFLSFYCLIPLYLIGIENYITKDRFVIFISSTTLLLFTNFYFFFTLSFLTPIYFLYRYYIQFSSFQLATKKTIRLIFYYLIGVGITFFLTLPTISYILQNERLGANEFNLFYEFKVYLHYLISTLIPNYLYIYRENVFNTDFHYSREICMYATSIVILMLPQLFGERDKLFKKATISLYIVIFVILLFPGLAQIIHGFSDPSFRWIFFIIIINIIVACRYIDNFRLINMTILKITLFVICGVLLLIIPLTTQLLGANINSYLNQWGLFLLFIPIYVLLYFIIKRLGIKSKKLILLVTTLEIGISGFLLYFNMLNISNNQNYDFSNKVTQSLESNKGELNNHLNYLDNESGYSQYYRVYVDQKDVYWDYSHNMSLFYDINGLMTYDSTYEPSLNSLKKISNDLNDFGAGWIFDIKDPNVINFLSTKFAIVRDEKLLVNGVKWKFVTDYNGLKIYKNINYRPLGVSYSKIKSYEEVASSADLLDYVICTDNCDTIESQLGNDFAIIENINYSNNSIYGTCSSLDDTYIVTSIPYNKGWTLSINGITENIDNVNGGFMGFSISKGNNDIYLNFVPYGLKLGASISLVSLLIFIFLLILKSKRITLISNIFRRNI